MKNLFTFIAVSIISLSVALSPALAHKHGEECDHDDHKHDDHGHKHGDHGHKHPKKGGSAITRELK